MRYLAWAWLVLLMTGGCDSLWPLDNPHDQRRCDPACAEGMVCLDGECEPRQVGGDASPRDGRPADGAPPDRPIQQDKPKLDKPKPDKAQPDKPKPCGPVSCNGCCRGGQCLHGNTGGACGKGGLACAVCPAGHGCVGGQCKPTQCGPHTCKGCCQAGKCLTMVSNAACGQGGKLCVVCKKGQTCQTGACKLDKASQWGVAVVKADIKSGKKWDNPPQIAPDPFMELTVWKLKGKTTVKQNTYNPVWNELVLTTSANNLLQHGISFKVFDQDPGLDQVMASCKASVSETVLLGGSGKITCGPDIQSVVLKFNAK